MKVLKTWFGIICCLVSLTACSAGKLEGEGQEFVAKLLENQKKQWDSAKLYPDLDAQAGAKPEDLSNVFKMYSNVVGPISTIDKIERLNYRAGFGIGVPDFNGTYRATVKCDKGPAKVDITVSHKDGKWTVLSFFVKSDAFQNVNSAEREQAQKFVDQVARQICESWNVATLDDNADPVMAAEMEKTPLLMKGLFAASKGALGPLKSYSNCKFVTMEPYKSQTIYQFVADEEFAKGTARLQFAAIKVGDAWKLRGTQVNSNRRF